MTIDETIQNPILPTYLHYIPFDLHTNPTSSILLTSPLEIEPTFKGATETKF